MQIRSWSRTFFILILFSTSAVASLFMIFEAAEFYARFYPGDNGYRFGLIAALLNEAFLVIMAAVWLPSVNFGGFKLWHPGNVFIKSLMVILFFNTVGGATFNVIEAKLGELQQQKNHIAILKIREEQLINTKKKLNTFIKQNQRINTAIAAKELTSVQAELVKLRESSQSSLTLWVDIIMLTFLRFSIQLSNITSVWIGSWLYRQPNKSTPNVLDGLMGDVKGLGIELKQNKQSVLAQSLISEKKPSLPKNITAPKAAPLVSIEENPPVISDNGLNRRARISSGNSNNNNNNKQKLADLINVKEPNIAPKITTPKITVLPADNELAADLAYQANELKFSINDFLSELSPDQSIESLCRKLGIDHFEFNQLQQKNGPWLPENIKKLTEIKLKIEKAFHCDRNI